MARLPLPERPQPQPCHRQPGGAGDRDPHRVRGHPRAVAQEAAGAAVRGALRLRGPQRRRADGEGGRQAVGDREARGVRAGQEAHRVAGVRTHPGQLRGSAAGRVRQTQLGLVLRRWYYGNINRVKAEKLLLASQNKDGSFLVRISESHSDEYTISARSEGKVYHFRIQRSSIGAYFVSDKISFATLGELISYYQKNPRSLGVLLEEPCAQQRELFDMEPWERPREEFKLHKKLGEGHFGQVWEALWTTENKNVAIKMLKQEDTKQDEFVKEVQALKSLHHPKLIQLLAMCSRGEPVYIVTELMSKGSLKSYLASAEGQVLTSAHLIYMGSQIAEGMAYLEDRNIVHRDLAARNILVGDDLVCKVADFGLARIIKDSVYTASRSTKIPVRWTAPEAAIYQRFSVKSDVWSFGVLLYEMMSRGKMPYEGKSNKEVLDLLSSGFRLPCPTRCPQNIYRIMMDCWAAEPSKRPSFHALHSQLDTIYARIYFKTIEV
ncbi:tyrosine-protein kinase Srms isoform X2 [Brachyistius frenatus]|uniref:tyrosine-protein kinase Srms isoform X2 n=1 Tax=Brachyistius frenatus TaxID=100188 RepID=UPI0037E9C63E